MHHCLIRLIRDAFNKKRIILWQWVISLTVFKQIFIFYQTKIKLSLLLRMLKNYQITRSGPTWKCIKELIESSSKNLTNIYQWFTKDLPKIKPYLAFYLLKTYQGFTKDLLSLPNTYQKLTKIFFQFTKHLPKIFDKNILILLLCTFSKIFSYSQLALQVLMKTGDLIVANHFWENTE